VYGGIHVKSGLRALIVSLALFLFWGTTITEPFRTFATACHNFFGRVLRNTSMPPVMLGFVISLMLIVFLIILIFIGSSDFSRYLAGICAALGMLYYLYTCIQKSSYDFRVFPIAVGLALALLFLIFQADHAGMWLADAYVYSLLMLLFVELILSPLSIATKIPSGKMIPFFAVPVDSLATKIGNFLDLPMLIWSGFLFALMLIPVLYFSRNRKLE
jgi:hypothetical protein